MLSLAQYWGMLLANTEVRFAAVTPIPPVGAAA
jgi:hypothetical protein